MRCFGAGDCPHRCAHDLAVGPSELLAAGSRPTIPPYVAAMPSAGALHLPSKTTCTTARCSILRELGRSNDAIAALRALTASHSALMFAALITLPQ